MTEPAVKEDFTGYYARMRHEPIYIILGVQGSGTNLLQRLLTRLFNFSVVRDHSLVFNAAVRLGKSPTRNAVEREIDAFERCVEPSSLRRKTGGKIIRNPVPLKGVCQELRRQSISSGADFARLIYAYRAFRMGAAHIGIKSDDIWQNIDSIDQAIPNKRIIFITRDFRDNLLSVAGKDFGPIEPLCAATYVKRQLGYYMAAYRRAGASAYHVRFDTLVNSTRQFADDFAHHFQLTPSVNLDVAVPALEFRPNKIGKWKALDPQELAWCEGILKDELREFGYECASAAPQLPGPGQLLVASARDKIRRVPQKLRWMASRVRSS